MSSSSQAGLGDYGATVPESTVGSTHPSSQPKLGFESTPSTDPLPDTIREARNVNWVVFTGRYPYVFDAARLGFGIGHREDSSYQWVPDEVSLPVHFLDNEYLDADLDRFIDRVFEYEPEIAVVGDIYDASSLREHIDAANEIWGSYPDTNIIIVPKCEGILPEIPDEFVLGYPNGSSPIQATDIATYDEWRSVSNQIHILGGTPLSAYAEIVNLTQESITGKPPADIVGVDWNGYQRYAEDHGDYAAATGGWHRNLRDQYPPKRDLIRYSLLNAKHYWISQNIWPDTDPTTIQTRDELLAADAGKNINLNTSSDARELLLSPPPHTQRKEQPIYRTDDTQATIIEPLSPIATLFANLDWTPDGTLSGSAGYTTPKAHHTEPICTGCGNHILSPPDEYGGQPPSTAQVVSYEHQIQDDPRDYDSVPNNGQTSLNTDRVFPAIHCFSSETRRNSTEGRSPEILLDSINTGAYGWPDGRHICSISTIGPL